VGGKGGGLRPREGGDGGITPKKEMDQPRREGKGLSGSLGMARSIASEEKGEASLREGKKMSFVSRKEGGRRLATAAGKAGANSAETF